MLKPDNTGSYNKYYSPTNRQVDSHLTPPYKVYSRAIMSKHFRQALAEMLRRIVDQLTKAIVALIRGK